MREQGELEDLTVGKRIGQLAEQHPDAIAVITVGQASDERSFSWQQLERTSNRAARHLAAQGVGPDSIIGVRLPNSFDHVTTTLAVWKLGATVLAMKPELAEHETDAIRDTAGLHLVVGADISPEQWRTSALSDAPLAPQGVPRSAHMTGGSTGTPRIMLREKPWSYNQLTYLSSRDRQTGIDFRQTQLVVLPLYHAGFTALWDGLILDHRIVLLTRFVPALVPALIEKHRVNVIRMVPAMMRWILQVPGLASYDLSSIRAVHHGAARCPEPVKRGWLQLIGPEKVFEGYSSQERVGSVGIRGDDWLKHPGAVGKPSANCDIRIYGEDGQRLGPVELGEIYLRSRFTKQPTYLGGGEPMRERDGYISLGDLGYLDHDNYLHLVDRRDDVINVAGAKVYPAEIEEVLMWRGDVGDAAVIARAHPQLGYAPHAFVVPADADSPPSVDSLDEHCRRNLSIAKVPLSYEIMAELPRSADGKLSRRALRTGDEDASVQVFGNAAE